MDEAPVVVEPLGSQHDRASFSCGEPALDSYLRRQATQDARRRIAQVFVVVGDVPGEIIGYYTLSAASFEKDRLPADLARRLPHYPVPAVVIGRLAVDRGHQGRGLGEILLLDAIPAGCSCERRGWRVCGHCRCEERPRSRLLRALRLQILSVHGMAPVPAAPDFRDARAVNQSATPRGGRPLMAEQYSAAIVSAAPTRSRTAAGKVMKSLRAARTQPIARASPVIL